MTVEILVGLAVLVVVLFLFVGLSHPQIMLAAFVLTAPITFALGSGPVGSRLTVAEVAGAGLVLAWAVQWIARKKTPKHSRLFVAVWALGAAIIISVLANHTIYLGRSALSEPERLVELCILVYLLMIYTAIEDLALTERDLYRLLNCWLVAATVVVAIGLWDGVAGLVGLPQVIGHIGEVSWRYGSTFRQHGQLAVYLHETFVVALAASFLPGQSRARRIWLGCLLVATLGFLPFATRRSVYVGLVVSVGAILFLTGRSLRSMVRAIGFIFGGVSMGLGFLAFNADFRRYFLWRVEALTPEGVRSSQTFIYNQAEGAWRAFLENPLFGIGWGGYKGSIYDHRGWLEVHNTYLQVTGEAGLLGLLALMILLSTLIMLAYENAFWSTKSQWAMFSRVLLGGFLGILVSSAYNRSLRDRSFWILLAVVACLNRLNVEERYQLSWRDLHGRLFGRRRSSVRSGKVPATEHRYG